MVANRLGMGPAERRADGALQRQHERERDKLRAGDPKATRISEKLQNRADEARQRERGGRSR